MQPADVCMGRFHFAGSSIRPSCQPQVLVKDKVTLGDTSAYQEQCISLFLQGMSIEGSQIYIAQYVHIMDQHRPVSVKKRSSSLNAAAGIKELL